jgi:hypothetical protein
LFAQENGLQRRAAYQKALSMSQQEPKKRFLKKILAELSNFRGCQTTKGAGQIKPKEKYHAIHDADDPRRLSRR